MSKPDIVPKQSAAGIAVDPKTLERVIPESKRPDGSVRKQLKVRPGFTPQEDIGRFRGSRQQQLDRNQLPKGHILGWIAPSAERKPGSGASAANAGAVAGVGVGAGGGGGGEKPMTKSAAKNAKRKAKKQAEKEKVIKESWDMDSDEEKEKQPALAARTDAAKSQTPESPGKDVVASPEKTKSAATAGTTTQTPNKAKSEGDALAEELERKLDVH